MKNTLDLLRLTAKIIETWDGADIPEIERDTVLENLRKAYGRIKYTETTPAEACAAEPSAPAPVELADIPEPVAEPAAVAEPQVAAVTEPEPLPVPEVAIVPEPAPEPGPATVEAAFTVTPTPAAPTEEPSCIVNSEDEIVEVAANQLFAESEIPVKPKLDRKVILSLYGDDPAPVKQREERPAEPVAAPDSIATPRPVHMEAPVSPNIADTTEPVQVLGDVLNTGSQTLSDVYSEHTPKADVASVISSGKVDGLRKSIGINDKFLIMRNLFDGNGNDYDTVMSLLDEFDNLEDALIFIHENFDWNPDNEAVKLIIDLLTRKFS